MDTPLLRQLLAELTAVFTPPPPHTLTVQAASDHASVETGQSVTVTATVQESMSGPVTVQPVTVQWRAPSGTVADPRALVTRWTAGAQAGSVPLTVTVTSPADQLTASSTVTLTVTPSGPPPDVKPALTLADLHYDGLFTLPSYAGLDFSTGSFAARRLPDGLHFLMSGSAALSCTKTVEFRDPGAVGPDVARAPRASLVRVYENIYGDRRLTVGLGTATRGMLWHNGLLYWTYGDTYHVGGSNEPVIGCSRLHDDGTADSFGPWRTGPEISQKTRGYMVDIPAWFQALIGGASVGLGAPTTSGNAGSPWGAYLAAVTLPDVTVPADTLEREHTTIATRVVLYHDINRPQRRLSANYKNCNWKVKYDASQGIEIEPGGIFFTDIDTMSASCWVDTPTKSGLLFFGQMIDTIPGYPYEDGDTQTHHWYGPNICPHGQHGEPVSEGTGPAAGSMVPMLWAYRPSDLVRAAKGEIDPTALMPVIEHQLSTIAPAIPRRLYTSYQFGGAYFDATTNKLYVSMVMFDTDSPYEPKPVMLRFSVTPS